MQVLTCAPTSSCQLKQHRICYPALSQTRRQSLLTCARPRHAMFLNSNNTCYPWLCFSRSANHQLHYQTPSERRQPFCRAGNDMQQCLGMPGMKMLPSATQRAKRAHHLRGKITCQQNCMQATQKLQRLPCAMQTMSSTI